VLLSWAELTDGRGNGSSFGELIQGSRFLRRVLLEVLGAHFFCARSHPAGKIEWYQNRRRWRLASLRRLAPRASSISTMYCETTLRGRTALHSLTLRGYGHWRRLSAGALGFLGSPHNPLSRQDCWHGWRTAIADALELTLEVFALAVLAHRTALPVHADEKFTDMVKGDTTGAI